MKFDIKEKISFLGKKVNRSSLYMGLFLCLVIAFFGGSALLARESVPDNPIGEQQYAASLEEDTLLCESEINENVYVPVPVASKQTDRQEIEETDEGLNPEEDPEEPEEEPEEEEEPPEQEPQPIPQVNTAQTAPPSDGGNSGGNTDNGDKTSEVYFTTTIKDGETVTSPAYEFEITHKKDDLIVKQIQVTVNGKTYPQFQGAVSLEEGANTIRVKVEYTDAEGKTITPFKDYTVHLDAKSLVITTDLKEKDPTVRKDQFTFTATASYKGEAVPVKVTLNGKKVSGNGGKYRVRLENGKNTIVLYAEGGGLTKTEEYTFTYESDGKFGFETDLYELYPEGITKVNQITFSVWMVNGSENAQITVKHGINTVEGNAGESFTVTGLTYGKNTITITAKDGNQTDSRSYTVYFERPKAGPDNPNPDPKHAPTIVTYPDISQGYETSSSVFTLEVSANDYNGGRLVSNNIVLKLNEVEIAPGWQTQFTSTYRLNLYQTDNKVEIYMEDAEGYSVYYSYHITYKKTDGPIGYAIVSVEAPVLGLGWIIEPTEVPIYDNEPAMEVIRRFFTEQGFTLDMGDDGYLRRIYKEGIMASYEIPATLLEYLTYVDASYNGKVDPNSLGEQDLYGLSGWNVAVNELYTGYAFNNIYLRDGERLQIRFTLHLGMDIGNGGPNGNFPETFIMPYEQ